MLLNQFMIFLSILIYGHGLSSQLPHQLQPKMSNTVLSINIAAKDILHAVHLASIL